jgi:hypothetical protein
MINKKMMDNLSAILLLVGGICWGLIGAFGFDLIGSIFNSDMGMMSPVTRIVYVLVGLSALYRLYGWAKSHK